jgi:hypothetical protein
VSTEKEPASTSAPPAAGRTHSVPPFVVTTSRPSGSQRKSVRSETPETNVGSSANVSAGLGLPSPESASVANAGRNVPSAITTTTIHRIMPCIVADGRTPENRMAAAAATDAARRARTVGRRRASPRRV